MTKQDKLLKKFEADQEGAKQNLQRLQQQQLMVQGVVLYLTQEIAKLQANKQ